MYFYFSKSINFSDSSGLSVYLHSEKSLVDSTKIWLDQPNKCIAIWSIKCLVDSTKFCG